MEFILLDTFIQHPFAGYILVFLGMFIEGDIVLFAASFLAHLGVFNVLSVAAASIFGMFAGDTCWYLLGRYHEKMPRFLVRAFDKAVSPFDRTLAIHPFRTLLIGKFAYGIHRLILIRSGFMSRHPDVETCPKYKSMPFPRFFRNNLAATLIWVAIIVALGYFGGFAISQLKWYLRFAEVGLLICILAIFFAEKAIKKSLMRSEKTQNAEE